MVKGDFLKSETRKKIYDFILKKPGSYLNEISRKLKIPKSTVNYHLKYLIKKGVIAAEPNSRCSRYYIAKDVCKNDKKYLNILMEDVPCRIIMYLFSHPKATQVEISKYLEKHPTTISFHLEKLSNADMLDIAPLGNKNQYNLKDPAYVFDLFVKYGENFLYDEKNGNSKLSLSVLQKLFSSK